MWMNTQHEDQLAQVGRALEHAASAAESREGKTFRELAAEILTDIRDTFIRESPLDNRQLAQIFELTPNRVTRIRKG